MQKILILGGTTEARRLAARLAEREGIDITLSLALLSCATHPAAVDLESSPREALAAVEGSRTGTWHCRNDLEVRCAEGTCESVPAGEFTPMDVRVDDSRAMSVCAYSGCWEGNAEILRDERFLVWIGHDLRFSTSPDPESQADILVAIDLADGVASLKAGEFAHPLLCELLGGSR